MSGNIYTEAANILLSHKSGSLKSRIYSAHNASQNSRAAPARLYALIMETLKHQELLSEVIKNSGILSIEKKLNHTITLLLLHDHLLLKPGKDCIALSANHPLKAAILRNKARLNAELTRSRLRKGFPSIEALKAACKSNDEGKTNIPRWVRVNTVKTTMESVLSTAPFNTFKHVESLQELLEAQDGLSKIYHVDKHIPNLLAFPISLTQLLTNHHLYKTGSLILQDKASCFPAHILNPPPGSYVIDACAAPGNKTTHLAAIMASSCDIYGKGQIIAFERDPRRSDILAKMVSKAGADKLVQIRKASDFLKSKPLTDSHIGFTTHLLLDPSCSGSGIAAREQAESSIVNFTPVAAPDQTRSSASKKRKRQSSPEIMEPENEESSPLTNGEDSTALATRLNTLSGFQLTLLLHALSYPHAKRITYSTCSVYAQENEHVVVAALLSSVAKEYGWELDTELNMLQRWERRGIVEEVENKARELTKSNQEINSSWIEAVAKGCVRCEGGDGTGGFFVACFARKNNGKEVNDIGSQKREPLEEEEEEEEEEETYEEWEGIKDGGTTAEEKPKPIPLTRRHAPKNQSRILNKRTKLLKRKKK